MDDEERQSGKMGEICVGVDVGLWVSSCVRSVVAGGGGDDEGIGAARRKGGKKETRVLLTVPLIAQPHIISS